MGAYKNLKYSAQGRITQHAPAPLKRFGSVGELRKWAHAGGAAAWRRAERLKHARWQLEVDEYRVAHGLVGDVE